MSYKFELLSLLLVASTESLQDNGFLNWNDGKVNDMIYPGQPILINTHAFTNDGTTYEEYLESIDTNIQLHGRQQRDVTIEGVSLSKPKTESTKIIIPYWNHHIKTNPWNTIGHKRNKRNANSLVLDYNGNIGGKSISIIDKLLDTADAIHHRERRELTIGGNPIRKPKLDVSKIVVPNWNPHIKTNPMDTIGHKRNKRNIISLGLDSTRNIGGYIIPLTNEISSIKDALYPRNRREITIGGNPIRKPKLDVTKINIPNWNPNIKTNPWNSVGQRHRRGTHVIDYSKIRTPSWNPYIKTHPLDKINQW